MNEIVFTLDDGMGGDMDVVFTPDSELEAQVELVQSARERREQPTNRGSMIDRILDFLGRLANG